MVIFLLLVGLVLNKLDIPKVPLAEWAVPKVLFTELLVLLGRLE